VGSHGLGGGGHVHDDQPYTVVGILAPTARAVDRLALTATESVWQVHEAELAQDDEDRAALQEAREITLALIRYQSPLAAVSFPRWVQTHTPLQAAAPALELARLLSLVGMGVVALQALGGVLVLSAGLGVFAVMWQAVRERRSDLALLRMLGAPPTRLLALLLTEAGTRALLGALAGLVLAHAVWGLLALALPPEAAGLLAGWPDPAVWWPVPVAVWALALVAAALAARGVYRLDVAGQLQANGP
jgi:putative ABC transport system permease protein